MTQQLEPRLEAFKTFLGLKRFYKFAQACSDSGVLRDWQLKALQEFAVKNPEVCLHSDKDGTLSSFLRRRTLPAFECTLLVFKL